MARHRGCTDIAADILKAANEGATRTRILHGTGLSTKNMKKYMDLLVDNDLLGIEPVHRMYSPTEKGSEFLQIYGEMEAISAIIAIMKNKKF